MQRGIAQTPNNSVQNKAKMELKYMKNKINNLQTRWICDIARSHSDDLTDILSIHRTHQNSQIYLEYEEND